MAASTAFIAGAEGMGGKWLRHPSFYENIERIQPGEEKVYFFLHQQPYLSNNISFAENTATLFVYDKSNPGSGIVSLNSLYPNFPVIIRAFSYSPTQQTGVAVAEDGNIWLLPDNGTPSQIGALKSSPLPGKHHITSITESPTDGTFWIGMTYGYAVVDPAKGTVVKGVRTDYPVDNIVKMGDRLVIVSDGKAYTAPASSEAYNLSSLTRLNAKMPANSSHISDGNGLSGVKAVMPLTDNTFAFIGFSSSGSGVGSLGTVSQSGGNWNVALFGEDSMSSIPDNEQITGPLANNAVPVKDGYYVQAKNSSYLLKRGIDPTSGESADSYKGKVLSSRKKGDDAGKESASWDMNEFWFFTPKDGFYTRTTDGNSWSNPSSTILPSAPVPYISSEMKYHPQKGMVVTNHGPNWIFSNIGPSIPWLISSFKDGKWTNLSPAYYPHAEFANDEALQARYEKYINKFPLCNPNGVAFSSKEPSLAYAGSHETGWARVNLDNPSELPLHIGHAKNDFASTPGFIDGAPVYSGWPGVCNFSAPSFDNDGRLWMMFYDFDLAQSDDSKVTLHWYSESELVSMRNANTNASSYKKPHVITVPVEEGKPLYSAYMITLKNPTNKNIIAYQLGQYGRPLYLYDHNGTPEDLSDDRYIAVTELHDAIDGRPMYLNSPVMIWEDEKTGLVWMSTWQGTFTVDPQKAFTDPKKAVSLIRVKTDGSSEANQALFEAALVTGGINDDAGNLWVSTHGSGLWCISPERDEVLGEYNMSNSGIPSNKIYTLAYNPERRSVMLSTDAGYAEFFPEILGSTSADIIRAVPGTVTPDFRGNVSFTGLASGKTYVVADSEGQTVKTLGSPVQGSLQWDTLGSDGKRVATGKYYLKAGSETAPAAEVIVLN